MKIFYFILLSYSFSSWAIDSQVLTDTPSSPPPWIVRVYYDTQQQLQNISDLTPLWQVNRKQKFATLLIDNVMVFNKIKSLKLDIRLEHKLQEKYFSQSEKSQSHQAQSSGNNISGYGCYSTVEGTFARMESLLTNNPTMAEIIDIGSSWEKSVNPNNGYNLKVLRITNREIIDNKPIVFITSAIHAREYATAELTTRFAEHLLENYDNNADIQWMLDHHEVQLLIHTNPDGRKKAETGILWRKNTNQAYCAPNSNSRGADLNRNYPFLWQSSNDQCGETFPGASAQSEPEVSAIMTHIQNIYEDKRGDLLTDPADADTAGVFLDIHSFSQLVLWPWGFTSNDNPNKSQYEALGRRVAYFNGYTPEPISDFTIAVGGSIDTSYGDLGVASLAFELGTDFFQDCETFESTILPDNLEALLYITKVARTPYITPFGPDIENLQLLPNYILAKQNFTVSGLVNDDRYNHSHGTQAINQVHQVDLYINDLPWLNINAQSIAAEDGNYDSPYERFNAQINSHSLETGKHLVFVVAKDSNNIKGAVSSKFLNVVNKTSVGRLNGTVTNAITGENIQFAQLDINQSIGQSNQIGQYSLLVPPTNSSLKVQAQGFSSQLIDDVVINQQQSTLMNVQLEPFCSVFSDDIESGINDWIAEFPWAIVNNQSTSPSHSWTDSPNGDYANNSNKSITSENILIAGSESIELSFNHLCNTEAGFDYGHVEVKFDNGVWQNIFSCNGQTSWKSEAISLAIPEKSQIVQLRFRLSTDGFITADGWYIDDVNLKVAGQPCRTILDDIIYSNGFEINLN